VSLCSFVLYPFCEPACRLEKFFLGIFIAKMMTKNENEDLPIIQKTYDLITWYVPILNRLPRNHKFMLGDRMATELYDILEGLILARYAREKLPTLEILNGKLDILRYQTRLLLDFKLISTKRYQYAGKLLNDIGMDLGAWIKQQHRKTGF